MRLALMGTPDFAVPTLDALLEAGHEIAAVYTQPPRPAGRGKALAPSPVQRRAEAAGIEVRTPASLRDPEAQAAFAALDLDVAVVAAYGLILPAPILEAPRHGCLNVHASLLPRWRGAAPIQRAILAGDEVTGVCIMHMERGLDTGPVYMRSLVPILQSETAGQLADRLADSGARMMADVLERLDGIAPEPQRDEGVTYAAKVDKAEMRIDFSQSVVHIDRQIRAFNPPGAWFEYRGERIRILEARPVPGEGPPGTVMPGFHLTIACGEGALMPKLIQRAGRAAMSPEEFLRGFPIPKGTLLA